MRVGEGDTSGLILGTPLRETVRPSLTSLMGGRSAVDLMAPLIGVAIIFAVWLVGAWQEWARGFVIYPWDAVEPIFAEESSTRYWRATKATLWAATRGLLIGGSLAFVSALVAAGVPGLRRSIIRLAAIANAAPWVAIAPCLIIILDPHQCPAALHLGIGDSVTGEHCPNAFDFHMVPCRRLATAWSDWWQ